MNNIKAFRKKSKLTQVQLAELIDMSNKSISHYETGRRMPSLEVIKRMSISLNCKPGDLYPVLN